MVYLRTSSAFVAIIVTAVITALAVGTAVYFWQQNVCLKNSKSSSEATTTSPAASNTNAIATTPATTVDLTADGTSPSDVTKQFILYTLGTVPGAEISYDKAKTLVSRSSEAVDRRLFCAAVLWHPGRAQCLRNQDPDH